MKILRVAFTALAVLLPVFLLPVVANASAPTAASGSFTSTVDVTSVRQVGGNTIIAGTETQDLTGFFTGTRVASGIEILHADGTFEAHDTGTFTGTVNGRSGTVVISGASTGTGNSGSGHLVAGQGTGELKGLDAQGIFLPTITGPNTAAGTYSIRFHFAP